MTQAAAVAFLWGDDAWGLESATEAFRTRADLFPFGAPERWRLRGDDGSPARVLGALQERLTTGAMFGSGTLAVLAGVGPLVRRGEDRNALITMLGLIAPGNGLIVVEETASGRKDAPTSRWSTEFRAAGGTETQLRAPRTGELTRWIEMRARELGVNLGPGAAQELATRIGGFVAEGDIDRRRQGQLAFMELGKLALFRMDGAAVSVADVQELVPEAVPGSIWGFVDAIGLRNVQRALGLVDRILESTPGPVRCRGAPSADPGAPGDRGTDSGQGAGPRTCRAA